MEYLTGIPVSLSQWARVNRLWMKQYTNQPASISRSLSLIQRSYRTTLVQLTRLIGPSIEIVSSSLGISKAIRGSDSNLMLGELMNIDVVAQMFRFFSGQRERQQHKA